MMDKKDRNRLRSLAQKQMDYANSQENLELVEEWKRHNARKQGRPIVHVEIDTFEQEIIEPFLECADGTARELERDLLRNFTNLEKLHDDWPVPPYFGVQLPVAFHLFGFEISRVEALDGRGQAVGHHFNDVIGDLEEDYEKLAPSTWTIDREGAKRYADMAQECFGDILPVRMTMASQEAVPTQKLVHMMGMENMFMNMYDYPELFRQMMERVADDYISFFRQLERERLLFSTTGYELLRQGSKCFTQELPEKKEPLLNEVWGFMDSQETVSISPDMYHELIFPCYRKIGGIFGLLSYGCCEPVSNVWEDVKTLPNLRKVSVSPWCDEKMMGEVLADRSVIYQRKPSPNFLGVDVNLDEDAVRGHIRETMSCAKGCVIEFTQRDVYTIHGNIDKAKRYVELIREETS